MSIIDCGHLIFDPIIIGYYLPVQEIHRSLYLFYSTIA